MLGGVRGGVTAASSRRPSRWPARRVAPPFRALSGVCVACLSVYPLPLRPFRPALLSPPHWFHLPRWVSSLIFHPRCFSSSRLTPPSSLQVRRTIACIHGSRVALAAGQVCSAAAHPAALRSTPTPRTFPRHPPQHAAHRRPCLCPPHCLCCCIQLCGTCGVFPFHSSSCPSHRVPRTRSWSFLTRPSLLRRLTAG